ncbi:MAG: FAD/NAD(P)-binding protein [Planctomycetota bacterium]
MENPYVPYPVTIADIRVENDARDLKTFKLVFDRKEDRARFVQRPGQFAILTVFGKGEIPIGIASAPTEGDHLLFTIKRMGAVTTHLHNAEPGMKMGVRGPLGNAFPLKEMEGRNIVIIGGGFAFTTLRATINWLLDKANRGRYGDLTAIYGARSPGELLYKPELKEWEQNPAIKMHVTVDKRDLAWTGREGFVPTVTKEVAPKSENAFAIVCGPPIMIRFTIPVLRELGFKHENIILSLENRMKCGIGKCGRCNIGKCYVCTSGPVFTYAQLETMPDEY